ncbi:MAG: hypothetical protein ACPGWR_01955, partial [Ardenticatenaceae bacterium]
VFYPDANEEILRAAQEGCVFYPDANEEILRAAQEGCVFYPDANEEILRAAQEGWVFYPDANQLTVRASCGRVGVGLGRERWLFGISRAKERGQPRGIAPTYRSPRVPLLRKLSEHPVKFALNGFSEGSF